MCGLTSSAVGDCCCEGIVYMRGMREFFDGEDLGVYRGE